MYFFDNAKLVKANDKYAAELPQSGINGKVDVSEMMGSSVHLHIDALGRDVVVMVSTMNMTGAEVAALANGNPVTFNFAGHVLFFYVLNLLMVSLDLIIYVRNHRLDNLPK